ncbi:hypothetical protein BCR39DRAFT_524435 [Naematelia encephala]|uniref:Uncharacterized protein n=1 Tax=Naematelia encephala TaxID=71784 RepID=A0A1Y2BBS7_9TREE|nr:hypothetical protein BCR39DRAFT_524435 [Naematelia encephala]
MFSRSLPSQHLYRTFTFKSFSTITMTTIDSVQSKLFARPLPPLEPGKTVWDPALTSQISDLKAHQFVKAALHLANDDIKRCHDVTEKNQGDPTADVLHAVLHRREGDYWNSKYWISNVSSHPLFPSTSSAKKFVDSCESVKPGSDEEKRLRETQWEELKRIVVWTRENC